MIQNFHNKGETTSTEIIHEFGNANVYIIITFYKGILSLVDLISYYFKASFSNTEEKKEHQLSLAELPMKSDKRRETPVAPK